MGAVRDPPVPLNGTLTGLTVGVLWSFRYRVEMPKQPMGDGSDPLTLTVT